MTFTRAVWFGIAVVATAAFAPHVSAAPSQAGAVLIRQPGPADAAQVDGVAILRVLARPGERVREANLGASSGNPGFDAAALRAVRRWSYVPTLTGDSAEPEWLLVRMVYAPALAPRLVRAASR